MIKKEKYLRLNKILLVGVIALFVMFWVGGPAAYAGHKWFFWLYVAGGFATGFAALWISTEYKAERNGERRSARDCHRNRLARVIRICRKNRDRARADGRPHDADFATFHTKLISDYNKYHS